MTNHLHWVWLSNQTDVAKYFHFQNIFPTKKIFFLSKYFPPQPMTSQSHRVWWSNRNGVAINRQHKKKHGNENVKLDRAYFVWHCCGGSERLGGNDKLGLRRYTLDCPPPLTSCSPLSFPALSLSWKVEGLQLRWKGARLRNRIGKEAVPCKSGGEHGQTDG